MKKVIRCWGVLTMLGLCIANSIPTYPKTIEEPLKWEIIETTPIEPDPVTLAKNEVRFTTNWECETTDNTIEVSYADAQLLMRIAAAEAQDQGVYGMYLVMQTVWNRVQSPLYPDTVWGVISQPSQFEPITNGSYYTVEITPEAHEALAMFESNLNANTEIVAFESIYNNDSLTRYYDMSFTYLGHTFYKQKD